MLDIPQEIQQILDYIDKYNRKEAYNLLFRAIKRYGMRWEYFI